MVKKAKKTELDTAADILEAEIARSAEPVYTASDVYNFLEDLILTRGSNRYYNDVMYEWERKVKKDVEDANG